MSRSGTNIPAMLRGTVPTTVHLTPSVRGKLDAMQAAGELTRSAFMTELVCAEWDRREVDAAHEARLAELRERNKSKSGPSKSQVKAK